jgi:proteic killer suppression protein
MPAVGEHGRSAFRCRSPLDACHVTRYTLLVIKTFADKRTKDLYDTGRAKRFPPDVAGRAARKLEYVDLAIQINDLKVPPGNRLHALEGDRKGQYSISINDQWRICFRFVVGDAYDVEVRDYH